MLRTQVELCFSKVSPTLLKHGVPATVGQQTCQKLHECSSVLVLSAQVRKKHLSHSFVFDAWYELPDDV